jgi:hypothetical protein
MQDRRFIVHESSSERSLGDLFGDLARETGILVRQEVHLATTEMAHKMRRAGKHTGLVGAGGALLHAGLLAIVAAAILGLGVVIPMWLSALIVGLVVAGGGYALVQSGLNGLKRIDPAPHTTIETLKEDTAWLKDQMR